VKKHSRLCSHNWEEGGGKRIRKEVKGGGGGGGGGGGCICRLQPKVRETLVKVGRRVNICILGWRRCADTSITQTGMKVMVSNMH